MCKKCKTYGTFCSYDPKYCDLQSFARGASTLKTPLVSENQTILGIVNGTTNIQPTSATHLFDEGYQFSVQDLNLLHKFHTRTIMTLGAGKGRPVYQNAYANLAYSVGHIYSILLLMGLIKSASVLVTHNVDSDNHA